MDIKNLSDAEFKTLIIRMFKELNENLNSIKKDPVRNKEYTNWNKEKLTGKQQYTGWSQESNQWFGT